VTHLRQIMLEELRRRNYAESTIDIYIHTVEHFSRHFHRSPDQLGPGHIRQYQAALFTRWKLAPNTVIQRLAALRFFYVQVLKRGWSVASLPGLCRFPGPARSDTYADCPVSLVGW
jgi:integrase/recombinase XerD